MRGRNFLWWGDWTWAQKSWLTSAGGTYLLLPWLHNISCHCNSCSSELISEEYKTQNLPQLGEEAVANHISGEAPTPHLSHGIYTFWLSCGRQHGCGIYFVKTSFPDYLKYYFSVSQTYFHVKCCLSLSICVPCKWGVLVITPSGFALLTETTIVPLLSLRFWYWIRLSICILQSKPTPDLSWYLCINSVAVFMHWRLISNWAFDKLVIL